MLSKIDIEKELGKGINISPFNSNNIKENSINLSASEYAWTNATAAFYINSQGDMSLEKNELYNKRIDIKKGHSSLVEINNINYIILLPLSTTFVQTSEVIAVDNRIGGTYHSKVSIASLGIGHIGTMLGPNFSGHSLISLHNVSNDIIKIQVGETIVSLVFNYLDSPIDNPNPTISGHIEKLSEFGINLTFKERELLNADWKRNIHLVREHMESEEKYKLYKKLLRKRKFHKIDKCLNLHNIILIIFIILFVYLLNHIAMLLDINLIASGKSPVWVDRFWTVGFSGIFIPIFNFINRYFKT